MFGDKAILGQSEAILDNKSRMFMPVRTNCEKNERLVLVYDYDVDCYKIYNLESIEKIFTMLNASILNAKNKKEEIYYKKRLLIFSKNIIKECSVDSLRRINLGDSFAPSSIVTLIGANDHLIIEPTSQKKK